MFRKAPVTADNTPACSVLRGCKMTHITDTTVCQPSSKAVHTFKKTWNEDETQIDTGISSLTIVIKHRFLYQISLEKRCEKIKFKFTSAYFDMKAGYCTKWLRPFIKCCKSVTCQWCKGVLLLCSFLIVLRTDHLCWEAEREEVWAGSFFWCWALSWNQLCSLSKHLN